MFLKFRSIFISFLCLIFTLFILTSCSDSDFEYTIEAKLNPNRISPLTALLQITAEKPCRVSIKVLGETPIEQSFEKFADNLSIPVVGLYPNKTNNVVVNLKFDGGEIVDTVKIKTNRLPNGFPNIKINKLERTKMESGLHACDIHFANYGKFNSIPLIFDDQGEVRWYLDLSFIGKMVSPFQRLKEGTILMVDRFNIYEFNMLGKLLKQTTIDSNYGMHHDVVELPNGDLLVCVGKRDAYININGEKVLSDSDFIMLFDRKKSKIVREWDLAKHLDVSRNYLNFLRKGDWLHMNGLAFNPKDSTIIVSGKDQGVVKISWNDELKWILAPKRDWKKSGRDNKGKSPFPFVLTAKDSNGKTYANNIQQGKKSAPDFDFPLGQHAPEILPNGNLIVFDNGARRNINEENNYSRAVEFHINEIQKTVTQVWEYGKERGNSFYSSIIGDVDFLHNTKNILITSGFIDPNGIHSAKIIEVNHETGNEVFEATLHFKNLRGNRSPAWGQSDILYRSERLELKY